MKYKFFDFLLSYINFKKGSDVFSPTDHYFVFVFVIIKSNHTCYTHSISLLNEDNLLYLDIHSGYFFVIVDVKTTHPIMKKKPLPPCFDLKSLKYFILYYIKRFYFYVYFLHSILFSTILMVGDK